MVFRTLPLEPLCVFLIIHIYICCFSIFGYIQSNIARYAAPVPLLVPELQYRTSGLCTIGRIRNGSVGEFPLLALRSLSSNIEDYWFGSRRSYRNEERVDRGKRLAVVSRSTCRYEKNVQVSNKSRTIAPWKRANKSIAFRYFFGCELYLWFCVSWILDCGIKSRICKR